MSRQLFGVVVGTLVAIATLALGVGASSAAPTRSPMPNPVCARHPDACLKQRPIPLPRPISISVTYFAESSAGTSAHIASEFTLRRCDSGPPSMPCAHTSPVPIAALNFGEKPEHNLDPACGLPGHWECWGSLFEFVNVPDGPTYEVLRNNTLIDTIPHVAGREAYGIRAGVPILT